MALLEDLPYGVIFDVVLFHKLLKESGVASLLLNCFLYARSWVEYCAEFGHDMEGSYLAVFSYEIFADFVGRVGRSRADCCLVPGVRQLGWCPAVELVVGARCSHHACVAWIGVVQ